MCSTGKIGAAMVRIAGGVLLGVAVIFGAGVGLGWLLWG